MARAKHRRSGCLSRLIGLMLLIALLGYPFYEAWNLQTVRNTLEVPGLSKDLDGLTIVYLSDIHAGPFFSQRRVDALVTRINSFHADLVLLGGDYGNDSQEAIGFFQNLPKIWARYLVAGVVGNHDRTAPESNLAVLQSAMINAGVLPLVNATRQVRVGGASLYLCGVDDYDNGHPQIGQVAAQMREEDYVIFLTHSPDNLPEAFATENNQGSVFWFDLALCGHTHGGQVTLFGKPLFRSYSKVSDRYLSGWVEENKAKILVSNGVGTIYLPVRLFAPPQMHVITLKRK